ncbi:hypothetical protein C4B63_262g31 [Trypanosoma cruzi]|uniref:Uncharacterized protein n=1 Tax=Trypanosoma cruzi TaxID=5693 RepID=A0A2V2ULQ6_TRYCR|nr:hypothetical protein C4B63_262g31 [Trypanosoma cruzi]
MLHPCLVCGRGLSQRRIECYDELGHHTTLVLLIVCLFSLRSSTWENFVLCGMESTRPLAHCRVVVSGSQDPVEYFVRAKDDGRTVMPAQSETRTGWLMSPVKLRSQLRHWMRAEQVALRCLLASRPSRWLIVKGIQEHSFSEGCFCWVSRTLQCRSIGLFFGGRMVFCTSWTFVVRGRVMGKHAHRFGVGAPRTCSRVTQEA